MAAAEGDAPFAHQGVVALREALDVPGQAGLASGRLHPLLTRLRVAVAQVVRQAGREQVALLGNEGHQLAQIFEAELGDIAAAD